MLSSGQWFWANGAWVCTAGRLKPPLGRIHKLISEEVKQMQRGLLEKKI